MVQGYHIYKGTWDALIGEEVLILSREGENYVNHKYSTKTPESILSMY